MREIKDHKVNGVNQELTIMANDEPGPGGANHAYTIGEYTYDDGHGYKCPHANCAMIFQKGPISESGVNGITNEALLAIVIDRLRGFQHRREGYINSLNPAPPDAGFDFNSRGMYACRENAVALTKCEEALMWLQKRTRDREARGVEGTMKV